MNKSERGLEPHLILAAAFAAASLYGELRAMMPSKTAYAAEGLRHMERAQEAHPSKAFLGVRARARSVVVLARAQCRQ